MLQKRNLVPDFLIQFLAVRSALKFQSYILHRQSNTSVRTNCTTIRKLKKKQYAYTVRMNALTNLLIAELIHHLYER